MRGKLVCTLEQLRRKLFNRGARDCVLAALTVFALLTTFSACGDKDNGGGGKGEKVTLKWAISWAGQADEKRVLEQVNAKLDELLPGINMEFVTFSKDRWSQQMASKEEIDIAWSGYSLNMDAEIANRSYLELNDLITPETTPNLYKEWKEIYPEEYESAVVDGKLYAIPNEQPLFNESPILKIPESIMEYFDVDAFLAATYASPTTTREVYEVLDKFFKDVWAAGMNDSDTVSKGIDIQNLFNYLAARGYSGIGSGTELVFKSFNDGKVELVNFAQTDEFKLFLEYASKWYMDGYIPKDVLVDGGASGSRLQPITAHLNGMWYELDDPERGIRKVYDADGYLEQYYINIEPEDGSNSARGCSTLGSQSTYCTIPYTTKHPEQAIKLLDLLRSPVGSEGNKLLNMLVYGIEGEHYTLEGDLAKGKEYSLQPPTTATYGKPHWVIGNVFLTYRTPNILEGQAEYINNIAKEKLKQAYKTPLFRFRVNINSIKSQVSNIASIKLEFHERLICGVDKDKYMTTYNSYIDKLYTGGLQEIINEVKKQTDAYSAPAE